MKKTKAFLLLFVICTLLTFANHHQTESSLNPDITIEDENNTTEDNVSYQYEVVARVSNCNGRYATFLSTDCSLRAAKVCVREQAMSACRSLAGFKIISEIRTGICK